MPKFSNSFTKEASVYRGVGFVKCCFGVNMFASNFKPFLRGGRTDSLSSLS